MSSSDSEFRKSRCSRSGDGRSCESGGCNSSDGDAVSGAGDVGDVTGVSECRRYRGFPLDPLVDS